MDWNDDTRTELYVTITTDVDPASATVALTIDGTEYSCTWDAAATVLSTDRWRRTAYTDTVFAGTGVASGELAGATVLTSGDHAVEVLLRVGGRILASSVPGLTIH